MRNTKLPNYIVIDFETANHERSSACAIGMIGEINGKRISYYSLINPKVDEFTNARIHGITESKVKGKPVFKKIWSEIKNHINEAEILVAHSAGFDKSVLINACKKHGIIPPDKKWLCTSSSTRRVTQDDGPYSLPSLCLKFGIKLKHHNALSDAKASEKILKILIAKCGSWESFINIAQFMKPRAAPLSNREYSSELIRQNKNETNKHWGELYRSESDQIAKIEDQKANCLQFWMGDYRLRNVSIQGVLCAHTEIQAYCRHYLSAIKEWRSAIKKGPKPFQESWIINELFNLGDAQKYLREQHKLLCDCNDILSEIGFFEKIQAKAAIPRLKSSHAIDIEMTNPETRRFEFYAPRSFICGSILDVDKNSCRTFFDGNEFVQELKQCSIVYSYNGEGFDFYQLKKYGLEIEELPCLWIRNRSSFKPKGIRSIDILDCIRNTIPAEHWWQNPHKLINLGVQPDQWPEIYFQKGLMGFRRKAAFKSIIDCSLAAHIARNESIAFEYIRLRREVRLNPLGIPVIMSLKRSEATAEDEEFCEWISGQNNSLIQMQII